jgi:hypothetical protein
LAVASVPQLEGFEGNIPAPMILVQAIQEQVHQAMDLLEGMILG